MRISATIKAGIQGIKVTYDEDSGMRLVTVIAVVKLLRGGMKVFGEEFHNLVFGSTVKRGDEAVFGFTEMKTASVCEMHELDICGHSGLACQPKVAKVNAVVGADTVLVTLHLPLTVQSNTMLGDLGCAVGDMRTIRLAPVQEELALGAHPRALEAAAAYARSGGKLAVVGADSAGFEQP